MGEYDKLLLDKESSSFKRRLVSKIIMLLLFVAVIVFATVKFYPYAGMLKTQEGREALADIIKENEVKGAILFTALQAAQIVLGVVPPLQILGGMLFGAFWGTVFSAIGIYLGSTVVFVLVKLIGYPIVQLFFSEKKISKYKFLQDEEKVVTFFALLYLLPGIPKDILTYVLPLSKMKKRDFFCVVIPSRLPAIILSGVVGQSIRDGRIALAIVVSVLVFVVTFLGIIFRNRIMANFQQRMRNKKCN